MKIVVTGGSGFIGSNLVIRLLGENHDMIITARPDEQQISGFKGMYVSRQLSDIDWNAVGKVDILFHFAAINDPTYEDRDEVLKVNFYASKELFRHAIQNGCRRIIYASSTMVYGNVPPPHREEGPLNPITYYGESKLLLDQFAMEYAKDHPEITIVGLRFCNVYGPRENHKGKRASVIYQFAQHMKYGNPKLFNHGEQKRDFIYVKDVVRANLLAMQAKESCIVNCAFGKAVSYNDLIKILNKTLKTNREAEYIDNPYGNKYQLHTECDMTLAKEKLGFVPKFDIETGIADYYQSGFLL